MQSTPSPEDLSVASHPSVTPHTPTGAHYYRLGIVGSKESGKTCLITALTMLRDPNPEGYTADLLPPLKEEDTALARGRDWIGKAKAAIEGGRWPEANPNDDEHKAIQFRFGDGQTRQKYVEVFDYSGELLNPRLSANERAAKLRDLLGQMDGLLVIAEFPLSSNDISKVEENLNGLMQAFALLVNDKVTKHKAAQVPIALIVNKWDRSEHFDQRAGSESQSRLLEDRYLKSSPPPYHVAVANALRPAAPGRFRIFAVSAMGPVERVADKELPPKGKLHSMGTEDPFLWLINQIDQLELERLGRHLGTMRAWFTPWPMERREIARLKGRIARRTPERSVLNGLSRKSWLQFVCGVAVWSLLGLIGQAGFDKWQHHRAETLIADAKGDWQEGTQWLRDYARSSPLNHLVYKRWFSAREAAETAREVNEKKDDEAFASIPKPSSDEPGRLDEAESLASEQLTLFPNSRHSEERKSVMAKVHRVRADLAFEKELSQWKLDREKVLSDRMTTDQTKLTDLQSLETTTGRSLSVPLDGPLREEWSVLLTDLKKVQEQLRKRKEVGDELDQIRQALNNKDYLKAANLLAGWQRPKDESEYPGLLNRFQLNVAAQVERMVETASQQGEKWQAAVNEAEMYLQPAPRSLLTDANIKAIENTIQRVKMEGDKHFYDLATKNKDTATLNDYLTKAPLQSMATDVRQYLNWLDEREKPREITFKLTKIKWSGVPPKGWTEGTQIKLFVNGVADSSNDADTGNSRTGESSNGSGIRSVVLKRARQADPVPITYQVYNVWFGVAELINTTFYKSPEELLENPSRYDSTGSQFTIEVEGVLPKPDLPSSWHEVR